MQLDASLINGSPYSILVAFAAGLATFFASCLLPLVPTYLAYLSGVSLSTPAGQAHRWRVVRASIYFVLGFVITFVLLGLSAHQLGSSLGQFRPVMQKLGGILFIFFGLVLLSIIKPAWVTKERRLEIENFITHKGFLHAMLAGVVFAFSWTPCIGPILAVILYWSAQQATALIGALLLLAYGLGVGLPFIGVALGFEQVLPYLRKLGPAGAIIHRAAGLLIVLAGILMLGGWFHQLTMSALHALGMETLAK